MAKPQEKQVQFFKPRMPSPQKINLSERWHPDFKKYDRKREEKRWRREEASMKTAKTDWAEKLAMKLLRPLAIDPDSWERLLGWVRKNAKEGDSFEAVLEKARKAQRSSKGITAMKQEAGKSQLVPFVFKPLYVFRSQRDDKWAWRSKDAGKPSPASIKKHVEMHNKSLEADGVNSHIGRRDAIYGGSVVNQKTGETVATWEDRGIISFYKNKPMFEVAHELVAVARLLAE